LNCIEFKELIQDYIDDEFDDSTMLTSEIKKEFEEHMEACPACKAEFTVYQKMINSIHALKPEKLPEGYCKRLNTKIKSARVDIIRKKRINFTKYVGIAAAFILVVFAVNFALSNLGGYSKNARDMAINENSGSYESKGLADAGNPPESPKSEGSNEFTKDDSSSNQTQGLLAAKMAPQEKIIKSGSLYIETIEFDKLVESLNQEIRDKNGYIENSEISIRIKTENKSYRYANLNIRVPQELFDDIIKFIEERSDVNSRNISESDVTKNYYDKQNVITNLEIQESRLRELYSKAENITDILALENEIRRIRTEIDANSFDLRDIDDRVSMATIQLSITERGDKEVNIKAEDGLWTRAKKGFIKTTNSIIAFIQSLIIWLISYALFIIPVVIVGIIIYRRVKKNKRS